VSRSETPAIGSRAVSRRLAIVESILSDTKGLRRHLRVALLPLPAKPRRAALIRNASVVLTHAILKNSNTRAAGLSRKSRFKMHRYGHLSNRAIRRRR
jgi:hypothetical protein